MGLDEPSFKNWLKTNPKVVDASNKYVINLFGGMSCVECGLMTEAQAGTCTDPLSNNDDL